MFVAAGVAALCAPAFAHAYGWPVKPFDQQHAIRGAFDDPRFGRYFHFGVDISAPDGTPVYAVAAGNCLPRTPTRSPCGDRTGTSSRTGTYRATVAGALASCRRASKIGFVRARLRPRALRRVRRHDVRQPAPPRRARRRSRTRRHPSSARSPSDDSQRRRSTATVEAYDTPPIAPPAPWQDARWTPALIRWRLLRTAPRSCCRGRSPSTSRTYHAAEPSTTPSTRPGRGRTVPARPAATCSGSPTASTRGRSPTARTSSRSKPRTRAATPAPPRRRSTLADAQSRKTTKRRVAVDGPQATAPRRARPAREGARTGGRASRRRSAAGSRGSPVPEEPEHRRRRAYGRCSPSCPRRARAARADVDGRVRRDAVARLAGRRRRSRAPARRWRR